MCRKTVWCYIIVLTLLDISLNTKLSAQGKSHGNGKIDYENGASVHESLMDGISLQDWGKESGGGTGRAAPAGVLALSPPALHFGHAALAVPHTLAVTITNTANETIHLASVAGSTPDFHASFFEAKTLGPLANTSFSVVFLGRREGPVRAALVLHTSRGAQRYSVGAVGVASAWRVWPLTGVRVPANCSVRAALTLYNPGPAAVQVSEVAASGAALALELPGAARAAPAAAWLLPPRATTHLVTLRLRPPPGAPPQPAYVRVRGNMTGGALVLCVEAAPAPPGDYLAPLQLRLAPRGSADPPDTFPLRAATSAPAPRPLQAAVLAAHCSPHAAPPLHAPALDDAPPNGAAAAAPGVRVALLRDQLEPHQEPTDTATLTLDYGAMWEQALSAGGGAHNGAGGGGGAGEAEGAWCGGWVRVGGAALPYSVRLVRGALRLDPPQLHFVSSDEAGLGAQTVSLHNELAAPLAVTHVDVPDEVLQHFEYSWLQPAPLAAGAAARVLRLRPRGARAPPLAAVLRVHTNLTHADLPLMLYSATLTFEWDWPARARARRARPRAARPHRLGRAPPPRLTLSVLLRHAGGRRGLVAAADRRAAAARRVPGVGRGGARRVGVGLRRERRERGRRRVVGVAVGRRRCRAASARLPAAAARAALRPVPLAGVHLDAGGAGLAAGLAAARRVEGPRAVSRARRRL